MDDLKKLISDQQLSELKKRASQSNLSVEELVRRVIRRYLYPDSVDEGWTKVQMEALWKHWDNDEDSFYDDL